MSMETGRLFPSGMFARVGYRVVVVVFFTRAAETYSNENKIVCPFVSLYVSQSAGLLVFPLVGAAIHHPFVHSSTNACSSFPGQKETRLCCGGFFIACEDFGRRFHHLFPACAFFFSFFKAEISLYTLIPLDSPDSFHSCWAS